MFVEQEAPLTIAELPPHSRRRFCSLLFNLAVAEGQEQIVVRGRKWKPVALMFQRQTRYASNGPRFSVAINSALSLCDAQVAPRDSATARLAGESASK